MEIITDKNTVIEFYVQINDLENHWILLCDNQNKTEKLFSQDQPFACLKAELAADTCYHFNFHGLTVCYCYYYEPERVLRDGITWIEHGRVAHPADFTTYDRPFYQESYHFTPLKHWMNDPNGLCWYQGCYHLFYQFHPYRPVPGCMYWGHAVSEDLVHWRHLPVVFAPEQKIMNGSEFRGGAWSGSALTFDDHVRIFFTRHIGPENDRTVKHEYQISVDSSDLLTFSEERVIIDGIPADGIASDIRDPKVFSFQGRWYMVFGSACNQAPAVLLYVSDNLDEWHYQGVLYQEECPDTIAFECPDFYELDGRYVLTVSKMRHVDQYGRKDTTHYYIGTFDGFVFRPEHEGLLDFGGNLYAVQSFAHNNRRLALGWVADFYQEHPAESSGVYGSMSLPRQFRLSPDRQRLLITPVAEIYGLLADTLYQGGAYYLSLNLPEAAYYVCLKFEDPCEFTITMHHSDSGKIFELIGKPRQTQFRTTGTASEGVRFLTTTSPLRKLELFRDHRTCEVFLNDGEAAGIKTFYGNAESDCFVFECRHDGKKPQLTVIGMGSSM